MADVIMVNSYFTRETFFKTFTTLRSCDPLVVYPSLNFASFDEQVGGWRALCRGETGVGKCRLGVCYPVTFVAL